MVTRAAGLVIFRCLEGHLEYLLLKASYGDKHWTPPKGHVDPGESEWITALRETKEEAGFDESDLEVYKDISKTLEYIVKGKNKTVIYWLAKLRNPIQNVILSKEHTALQWLELSEAQKLSGYADFNQMLGELHVNALGKM